MLKDRLRRLWQRAVRGVFRLASKIVFVATFAGLVAAAALSSAFWVTVLAGALAAQLLRVVFPTDRFRAVAADYWSGAAGDRWRRRISSGWGRVTGVGSRLVDGIKRRWPSWG